MMPRQGQRTPKRKRTKLIAFRVTAEERDLIWEGAEETHTYLYAFILEAATKRAKEVMSAKRSAEGEGGDGAPTSGSNGPTNGRP